MRAFPKKQQLLQLLVLLVSVLSLQLLNAQSHPPLETEADFHRAMEELSNWGRWGVDDEFGAANLITAEKRKAAAALVSEGIVVSLAHDVNQEPAVDASAVLTREVLRVSPTGASDRYEYSGSYHGTIHSHLDALDCHIMYEGKGYNGVTYQEVEAAGGCPRGDINVHKNGIVTRGILFDATLLPGKATRDGWLEPGTVVNYDDLIALEEDPGRNGGTGRCDSALHGPLEAQGGTRRMANLGRGGGLSRRRGVFLERTWRRHDRSRHVERCGAKRNS